MMKTFSWDTQINQMKTKKQKEWNDWLNDPKIQILHYWNQHQHSLFAKGEVVICRSTWPPWTGLDHRWLLTKCQVAKRCRLASSLGVTRGLMQYSKRSGVRSTIRPVHFFLWHTHFLFSQRGEKAAVIDFNWSLLRSKYHNWTLVKDWTHRVAFQSLRNKGFSTRKMEMRRKHSCLRI